MKPAIFWIVLIFFPMVIFAQTIKQKEINQQMHTWVSINSVTKFAIKWGFSGDIHIRTNDFLKDNNFYIVRTGIDYLPNPKLSYVFGYAHLWLAPSVDTFRTYSNENRMYQQVQLITKWGTTGMLLRLRNEQRWQDIIINDSDSGRHKFSNRIRYLISVNIPIFKKKTSPALVISDELLIHFGKEIVYNTFDQNRMFVGIRQNISPQLSYDCGYMNVYQQKSTGYQYDNNHTLRLFFYLNSSLQPTKK